MPTPDGPQFQSLWDSAMAGAQANLDAVSDEELDEAVAESMISDSVSDMISASQIEETGHTQAELSPQDRAFASRHQATEAAAEAMEIDRHAHAATMGQVDPDDIVFTVHPSSPEEFEAESHDEFRIRMFHRGDYQAGADYFTDDFDEVQEVFGNPAVAGIVLLPDPLTHTALAEQVDYDQHIAETGGSNRGWDGRGVSGTVSYDGGRIRSMSIPVSDYLAAWLPTRDDTIGEDPNDRDAYGRSWEVEAGTNPDYSQPDPFDFSDPEQARQAKAIEDMEETLRGLDERSNRRRNMR
ncbi:MAG: hypothetical protein CMQ15_13080 [Gammaproteobacteria bacterium]|nr:hypothetical protein [Gammaproteobacteria bacterium]